MRKNIFTAAGIALYMLFSQPVNASVLSWKPCFENRASNFECAILNTPLDYDTYFSYEDPKDYMGEWVAIPLIKLLANNPNEKKGSIVFNPGGPGNSGIDFILGSGESIYGESVRNNFDYIGFDPRGIARAEPLRCFSDFTDYFNVVRLPEFPLELSDYDEQFDTLDLFGKSCKATASDIIYHMSTTDVAYDMEMLRVALGEELLNFVGFSYGSFLGLTYANLYPEKVGRFILDGVIDPQQWSTGYGDDGSKYPVSMRLKTDEASQDTLNAFFRQCDQAGLEGCVIAGNSREKFRNIADTLRAWQAEKFSFSPMPYDRFIAQSLSFLYDTTNWKAFGSFLNVIQSQIDAVSSLQDQPQSNSSPSSLFNTALGYIIPQTIEGYPGVLCSDSDNPDTRDRWKIIMEEAENKTGYFAKLWAWNEAPCLNWPGSKTKRYVGPYNAYTATGMLIMNTRHDPATPLSGALHVRNTHVNSRLVIVEAAGHTTPFISACATNIADDYLTSGDLPAQDMVCQQDFPVFDSQDIQANSDRTQNDRSSQRRSIMKHIQ